MYTINDSKKGKSTWGHTTHPVLSKKATKEIDKFERKKLKHRHNTAVELLKLKGI